MRATHKVKVLEACLTMKDALEHLGELASPANPNHLDPDAAFAVNREIVTMGKSIRRILDITK